MSKSSKMYKDSPRLGRGESGDMEITRDTRKNMEKEAGADGAERSENPEAIPHHVRHNHERHMMHAKHEHEHAMHDEMEHGDKKEMHARHQKEMSDMHARHDGETGEGMISKVEKDEKE